MILPLMMIRRKMLRTWSHLSLYGFQNATRCWFMINSFWNRMKSTGYGWCLLNPW